MPNQRMELLNDLVNEVTKDDMEIEKIKSLTEKLGIAYSDNPLELLNNVLRGIHSEGPGHESSL